MAIDCKSVDKGRRMIVPERKINYFITIKKSKVFAIKRKHYLPIGLKSSNMIEGEFCRVLFITLIFQIEQKQRPCHHAFESYNACILVIELWTESLKYSGFGFCRVKIKSFKIALVIPLMITIEYNNITIFKNSKIRLCVSLLSLNCKWV